MSRSMTDAMSAIVGASTISPVILYQIGFASSVVYGWTGIGTVIWDSKSFLGTGNLVTIGPGTDTTDLSAQDRVITLEGVSAAAIMEAFTEVRRNLPVKLWLGAMNKDNILIDSPILFFSGITDSCDVDESAETSLISLTCADRLIRMFNTNTVYYTTADQQINWPEDSGFNQVLAIQDSTIRWGK